MELMDVSSYRSTYEKLQDLQIERNETQKQYSDVLARRQKSGETLEEKGTRFLADGQFLNVDGERLRLSHDELLTKLEVIGAAIQLQKKELTRQRESASKVICEKLAPEWLKLARRVRDLSQELATVGQAEHDFRTTLERSGVFLTGDISRQCGLTDGMIYRLQNLVKEADAIL